MEKTQVKINENGRGEIQLLSNDEKVGKMDVAIKHGKLTVYHTEVNPEHEGKGFASELVEKLVSHAKENDLKIVPLCPYVHAKFKRNPDKYGDVWYKK